jgi:hypothetical protein
LGFLILQFLVILVMQKEKEKKGAIDRVME